MKINDVCKSYSTNHLVLDKLTLTLEPGGVFGLLGPNGSGKSTLIKIITGVYPADEGDVVIDRFSIRKDPIKAKKKLGYVPDVSNTFLHLKGYEYLELLKSIYHIQTGEYERMIQELSRKFEMVTVLNDIIQNYSLGMRKKLLIIGSLIHSPKVWILDEPFNGLDPKSVFHLKELMRSYCEKGNVVLFSTHLLDIAQQVCNRIGILHKGKIVLNGPIEEIKTSLETSDALEKIFLELTRDE